VNTLEKVTAFITRREGEAKELLAGGYRLACWRRGWRGTFFI